MTKKSANKYATKSDVRHLGVLIENVGDQVKAIAEQHGSIINKLDDNNRKIEENTRRIEDNSLKIDENCKETKNIKRTLVHIEKKLDKKVDRAELKASAFINQA